MNLKPLRGYLLIEQIEDDLTTKSGLYMPETAKDKPAKGRVLALGGLSLEQIKLLNETAVPELTTDYSETLKVGDTVIFKRWGGQDIEEDGKELKIVKFDEIVAVYE